MKICRPLFIFQLLILPQLLSAAQVILSASTLTATIAEQIELRLIVRSLENIDEIKVSVPTGDYEIIRRQSQPLIKTAEWRTFEQVITIAFFKTGDFTVGPLDIELLSAKTSKEKEHSGTISIRIRSLLGENDKDIKPLKKLLAIKGNPLHLLKYLAGAALILLLGIVLLILKHKMRKKTLPVSLSLPAPEIELETRIRELWQQKLPQKGEYKLFFILLGEIIKHFLARTYSFNADDFTTAEISAQLKSSEKDSDIVACLENIFQQADLVKFAEQIPETAVISTLAEKIATMTGKYKKRRSLAEVDHVQIGR